MADTLTVAQAAALLNGLEYPAREIEQHHKALRAAGLVAVFGQSDDLMEFRGAIYDEIGAWDGATAYVDCEGLMPSWDEAGRHEEAATDYLRRKPSMRAIEAVWSPDEPEASWLIRTEIPHATFDIMEDGDLYCRGIIFALSDLARKDPTNGR